MTLLAENLEHCLETIDKADKPSTMLIDNLQKASFKFANQVRKIEQDAL